MQERAAAASLLKSVLSHLPSARIYALSFNFLPRPQAPDSALLPKESFQGPEIFVG